MLSQAEFVVKNADYLDWESFGHAIAAHLRERNGAERDERITRTVERRLVAA